MANGIRQNAVNMTADEKQRFVSAMIAIKANGIYDGFVQTHIDQFNGLAHRGPTFLPWHRRYLLDLEQRLQAVDRTVNIPYWDWTTAGATSAVFAADLMGGNGASNNNWMVTTGPFAVNTGRWTLNIRSDSNTYLRRQFPLGTLPTAATVNGALAINTYDTAPWSPASSGSFRNAIENIHNGVHVWFGGTMAGAASPNDPLYFLHHCNIDRLWSQWQAARPTATYLPSGNTPGVTDVNEPMTPWPTTPAQMATHPSYVYG